MTTSLFSPRRCIIVDLCKYHPSLLSCQFVQRLQYVRRAEEARQTESKSSISVLPANFFRNFPGRSSVEIDIWPRRNLLTCPCFIPSVPIPKIASTSTSTIILRVAIISVIAVTSIEFSSIGKRISCIERGLRTHLGSPQHPWLLTRPPMSERHPQRNTYQKENTDAAKIAFPGEKNII